MRSLLFPEKQVYLSNIQELSHFLSWACPVCITGNVIGYVPGGLTGLCTRFHLKLEPNQDKEYE